MPINMNSRIHYIHIKSESIWCHSITFSFINGLEMLHIVGTYEKAEEEEGEVYEVVNIKTLKQATPNLRIINLYGITFLDDTHIEAFSSNCIQLQVKDLLNLLKIPILIHISIITASNWIIQKHTCFISGTLCQLLCSRRRWKP